MTILCIYIYIYMYQNTRETIGQILNYITYVDDFSSVDYLKWVNPKSESCPLSFWRPSLWVDVIVAQNDTFKYQQVELTAMNDYEGS